MSTPTKIQTLTQQLYPNGRAFKHPVGGIAERLHKALAVSEAKAVNAAYSVLDSTIADNPNFTAADATDWERRLGLITSSGVNLADRIKAINQKLNYPGTTAPRQHYLFIQEELRKAGFNVYVYENNFGGVTQTPGQVLGSPAAVAVHAPTVRHGTINHGQQAAILYKKLANHIEEVADDSFVVGSNYRSTFFVSSASIATFADVPAARKDEFRQLILALKPQQTVGFLFINYV